MISWNALLLIATLMRQKLYYNYVNVFSVLRPVCVHTHTHTYIYIYIYQLESSLIYFGIRAYKIRLSKKYVTIYFENTFQLMSSVK